MEGLHNNSYIYTYIGHARGGNEHSLQFIYYSNYCSELVVWLLYYILFLNCCVRCAVWTSFVFEVNHIICKCDSHNAKKKNNKFYNNYKTNTIIIIVFVYATQQSANILNEKSNL